MKSDVRAERRFMLQTLRPYRFAVVLVVFCSVLASFFNCVSIGMLVPLLNSIQGSSDPEKLSRVLRYASNLLSRYPVETQIYLSIVLVVISMLLKNTLLGMSIYYGYRVSSRIAADLRIRATHMLLGVGLGFYHRTKAGELIEKSLYNTASLEDLTRHAVEMVAQLMTFLALFGFLFVLSWQLTIITVVIGAVFMWMTSAYTRRLSTVGENFATSSRELLSNVHENIGGIQLIKTFAREERQFARIRKAIDSHQRNTLQLNFRNYVVHLLTDVLGAAAIGGLFVVTMQVYEMEGKVSHRDPASFHLRHHSNHSGVEAYQHGPSRDRQPVAVREDRRRFRAHGQQTDGTQRPQDILRPAERNPVRPGDVFLPGGCVARAS